jgi:hypothetical protein
MLELLEVGRKLGSLVPFGPLYMIQITLFNTNVKSLELQLFIIPVYMDSKGQQLIQSVKSFNQTHSN